MTKADLIDIVAQEADFSRRQAGEVVASFLRLITDSLRKGEKAQLTPFGIFEVRSRKKREGRNPLTGESLMIPARKTPVFRAGKALRIAVGGEKKKAKEKR